MCTLQFCVSDRWASADCLSLLPPKRAYKAVFLWEITQGLIPQVGKVEEPGLVGKGRQA
jgi:hypothetical protein